jgi:hypothetical protein
MNGSKLNEKLNKLQDELISFHAFDQANGKNYFQKIVVHHMPTETMMKRALISFMFYLIQNYNFAIDFLTTNVSYIHDRDEAKECKLIFNLLVNTKTMYYVYFKLNDTIYKMDLANYIILHLIKSYQLFRLNCIGECIYMFYIHGCGKHEYKSATTKLLIQMQKEAMEVGKSFNWDNGIIMIKGNKINESIGKLKFDLINLYDSEVVDEFSFVGIDFHLVKSNSDDSIESFIWNTRTFLSANQRMMMLQLDQFNELISLFLIEMNDVKLVKDCLKLLTIQNKLTLCEEIGLSHQIALNFNENECACSLKSLLQFVKFNSMDLGMIDHITAIKLVFSLIVTSSQIELFNVAVKCEVKVNRKVISFKQFLLLVESLQDKFVEEVNFNARDYSGNKTKLEFA